MKLNSCEDYHILRGFLINNAEDIGKENQVSSNLAKNHILIP